MEKNLTFKLVVTDNDNADCVISETKLPYDAVANTISYLPESKALNDFYKFAALHPAPNVRENIAYKDKISEEVFKILSEDKSISVLRSLTRSGAFKKYADETLVKKLINLDSECAQNIAGSLEELEHVDSDNVLNLLVSSRDPSIRYSMVNNYSTPKRILKMFLDDIDSQVSEEAKQRLEN